MPLTLNCDRVEAIFGDDPLQIERITHRPSGRVICLGGSQLFLIRRPKDPSDPIFLREVSGVEVTPRDLSFAVRDRSGGYAVVVRIEAGEDGLRYHLTAAGPDPLWMVEWKIEGLDLREVVVPALGGQALSNQMPAEERLTYKYPFWWNAQFALGEIGAREGDGGMWLRTTEVEPRFKLFRAYKVEERTDLFGLGLGFEADAPLTNNDIEATWTLDGYAGSWRQPVERHRRWLEESFRLAPYHEHPHFPAWAGEINFILEFWGMRKDRGLAAHTFDATAERLRAFAHRHPPNQTLVYLPGFAEGGIDSRIPDYRPSEDLGGEEGLRRLVDAAHSLGYRVMIHTNVLGMTYTHPRFPELAGDQVVDQFGRPLGWGMDLDGDWLPEPYFAYMNPGSEQWGDIMEETLGGLIRDFDLDAVFLDQTLLAFNVSRGPNFLKGMRAHICRLQQAFPGVLFAGEGLHEQVLPELPMVQIHGIDSLSDVHGIEGQAPWRRVHPVSVELFGRHSRFVAHLLTRHPSSAAFARQEEAYRQLGVVPALVCYSPAHALDGPEVDAMLERARGEVAAPKPPGAAAA